MEFKHEIIFLLSWALRGVEEGWGEVIGSGVLWEAAGVVIGGTFPIKSYDIHHRTRVVSCKEKCPL